ncbi:hypothetical protein [Amycolatopsis albispora]|uniref:Uncharacterized protein n=1 Tax=Amycolatopsis albispora TaxID=1804986 RepID=A0A344LD57_9PSEU|nr:hypothetical protein [Amycolatopsis albispora]AXB45981.1 hypothetical protein A4R43_28775 [Amycolatopsis albispora]
MAAWPTLDSDQQREKIEELTSTVLAALPDHWQQLAIEYRQVGAHIDVRTGLTNENGETEVWEPPVEAWHRFQDLRGGMYRDGEGTWFAARYVLDGPERFTMQYNTEREPAFREPLGEHDVAAEQHEFPRDEAHMPDWYRDKLTAVAAA